MGKVKILDKITADKIAAGEVVERPASIAKELVENSLDAGAGRVEINLVKGGHEMLEVIDDGCGMSPDDLKTAVQRFATSKISLLEDLEGLTTFGFRGEALPSIAAVSRMEILTRENEAADGIRMMIEGGEEVAFEPAGTPRGTQIRVGDLFYNTPARRKFLKSSSSETAHIVGISQKLSLVNPDTSFRLTSNGREIFNFPSAMTVRERILKIWGLPLDYNVIPIEYETSSVRVSGFICKPDKLRSNRSYQYLFVNNRFIKNPMINQAVSEGFAPLLPGGKFPMALIFIDMIGGDVDINVHPNKLEVRFLRPGEIFKAVRDAIKQELKSFGYAPPEKPLPDRNFSAAASELGDVSFTTPLRTERYSEGFSGPSQSSSASGSASLSSPPPSTGTVQRSSLPSQGPSGYGGGYSPQRSLPSLPLEYSDVEMAPVKKAIMSSSGKSRRFGALAQIENTFIIGTCTGELWIVDQHTAHERINYEKLSGIGRNLTRSQRLLFPMMIELPAELFSFLQDRKSDFEEIGFEIEEFGGSSILIKAVPYGFKRLENKDNLLGILEDVAGEEPYRNLEAFFEQLRATIACKASVRAGDSLTIDEMNVLVNDLIDLDYSPYCPHGRPVVIKLSKDHLDKMFHRA